MTAAKRSGTSNDKVRAHRARLRADGLRPIQLWIPDVRTKSFREAARAQARAVASSVTATDDQTFIDAPVGEM